MKTKILFITTLLLFIGCSEEVKQIVKSPTIVQDIEKNKNDRIESISFYKQYENDNKLELIKKIEYNYNYYDNKVGKRITKYLKETEKNYKDGELNGLSTEWYEDGQKETEKNYRDGKLIGKSTQWYENGGLLIEMTYKDGYETGMSTIYFKNGNISRKVFWNEGNVDSLFSLSKDKENFSRILLDENRDLYHGEYNYWSDDDSLFITKTVNYVMGSKNGKQTIYNPDGSVLKVENCINDECN